MSLVQNSATLLSAQSSRGPRRRRRTLPQEVFFPAAPMLDMAFQLLAFFVVTFQAPSRETRLDLYLPSAPSAIPNASLVGAEPDPNAEVRPEIRPTDFGIETDLVVRASADSDGGLASLTLQNAAVPDIPTLRDRLDRYRRIDPDLPLEVTIQADDALRYELAARVVSACTQAGILAVRLASPSESIAESPARPRL